MNEEQAWTGICMTASAGAKLGVEALGDGRTKTEIGGGSGLDLLCLLAALTNSVAERMELSREEIFRLITFLGEREERKEIHEE